MHVAGHSEGRKTYQRVGFPLGPLFWLIFQLLTPSAGLSAEAWQVVALAGWMAIWWGTEAIPIPATSLLPLVVLPIMGAVTPAAAASPFANPVIFLLLGGFIIAMGMQRWNLHRRIALTILVKVGNRPEALIGGFMAASALLSMWVSNTATTLMMVPIALSVAGATLGQENIRHPFTVALLLSVAYAASIGGMGTLVGTPPNAMVAAYLLENMDIEVGFAQWMSVGVPIVLILVPLAWFVLTKWVFNLDGFSAERGAEAVAAELDELGRLSTPERRVLFLFAAVALFWIFRPLLSKISGLQGLSDMGIAIGGAVAMFVMPSGSRDEKGTFLLDWAWAVRLPWGVILLFGGGLSLAAAIKATGLAAWMGEGLVGLTTLHLFLLMLALVAMITFLTELTSNTATTAALLPVLGAIAGAGNLDPLLLAVPAAMAASCAFMLPVATAPNAVIFAGGHITIPEMAGAGFRLNLVAIMIITALCYALVPLIFT
ncbi:MAG: SLC13 family permease [Sphingomonadales bacterium]